jgi:rhamnulose-1-phosphate aldolase
LRKSWIHLGGPHSRAALDISGTAAWLASMGWSEASAGNISVCLPAGSTDPAVELVRSLPLSVACPGLAGRMLITTTAGSRFREIGGRPEAGIAPARISSDGTGVTVPAGITPTSELAAHVLAHAVAAERGLATSAVLHTHSTSATALSGGPFEAAELEAMIREAHPEVAILVRGGVRFIDFLQPGSAGLARATREALAGSDCIVWRGHGVVALGPDTSTALDILEITEKAAAIVMSRLAAFGPQARVLRRPCEGER